MNFYQKHQMDSIIFYMVRQALLGFLFWIYIQDFYPTNWVPHMGSDLEPTRLLYQILEPRTFSLMCDGGTLLQNLLLLSPPFPIDLVPPTQCFKQESFWDQPALLSGTGNPQEYIRTAHYTYHNTTGYTFSTYYSMPYFLAFFYIRNYDA